MLAATALLVFHHVFWGLDAGFGYSYRLFWTRVL